MDFSWFNITIFDIGIFSVSLVGLVWLHRQFNALQKESDALKQNDMARQKENDVLKQNDIARQKENAALRQQFREFQSAADRRHNTLQEEFNQRYNVLQKENSKIRQELDEVKQENRALRTEFDQLTGRYEELKDWARCSAVKP